MDTHLDQDGIDQLALRQGKSKLWLLGRMLLSSNVIQICVRVVMLVRMICNRLPAEVPINCDMNLVMQFRRPKKPQTCFSVCGSCISRMAFTLSRSISIPF